MKLAATIYGGIANKKTFAAIRMDSDKHKHTRILKLSKGTANQAELTALSYALSAIKPELRGISDLEVTTSSAYVIQITSKNEQGAFTVSPEKNIELVQEVREKLGSFSSVTFTTDKKSLNLAQLKDIVKAYKG